MKTLLCTHRINECMTDCFPSTQSAILGKKIQKCIHWSSHIYSIYNIQCCCAGVEITWDLFLFEAVALNSAMYLAFFMSRRADLVSASFSLSQPPRDDETLALDLHSHTPALHRWTTLGAPPTDWLMGLSEQSNILNDNILEFHHRLNTWTVFFTKHLTHTLCDCIDIVSILFCGRKYHDTMLDKYSPHPYCCAMVVMAES